jgi:hypothetical protein
MACGSCKTKKTPKVVDEMRSAMCSACGYSDFSKELTTCTINNAPHVILVTNEGLPCPLGRFPDRRGRIRWWGLTWMGPPWPIRVYLHMNGWLSTIEPDGWGCGCIYRLKTLGRRMVIILRRRYRGVSA